MAWKNGWKAACGALLILTAIGLSPAPAQVPDDVLVVGQIAEPKSLDPHAVTATNDFRILMNLYDGLVRFRSGTLEIEPALAEKWEISPDGKTYTFTLRQGVKFHDGTPFNAEAVKFNFDRMLDDKHPQHDTGPFPLAFFFSAIERTEAADPRTVVFHLKEPYAPLLSNLAYPTGLIVSPGSRPQGRQGFRPQTRRHRRLPLHRMAEQQQGRGRAQSRLLGRRTQAPGRDLPPADRRQHPPDRVAGRRPRPDGRSPARRRGPAEQGRRLQALRTGRARICGS